MTDELMSREELEFVVDLEIMLDRFRKLSTVLDDYADFARTMRDAQRIILARAASRATRELVGEIFSRRRNK